jgi:hypothetical protein
MLVFLVDSFHGTDFGASATIDACFRIDYINGIPFRNSIYRALWLTGTTGNALFVNFMCHILHLPFMKTVYYLFFKKTSQNPA